MNERIRELALQAGIEFGGEGGDKAWQSLVIFEKEDLAKFAELIVRECVELSVNSQYVNTKSEYYEGFNEALIYASNKIKKHFGVEE